VWPHLVTDGSVTPRIRPWLGAAHKEDTRSVVGLPLAAGNISQSQALAGALYGSGVAKLAREA